MRLRFETWWQKFIASIYVLSYVFSLVALVLTVIALSRWPGRIYEQFDLTRSVFSTFGLFWGAVLLGLEDIGTIFLPPIIIVKLLQHFKEAKGKIAVVFRFLGLAGIEAIGLCGLAFFFLDMYSDIVVMHLVLSGGIGQAPFETTFIINVRNAVLIITLIFSFFFRIGRHFKSTWLQKKASE